MASVDATADEGRAEVAHALAVGGERRLAPGESNGVAFAADAQIGGRLGKFERRRQRWSGLGATGEQQAESGRRDELYRMSFHAGTDRVSEAPRTSPPASVSKGFTLSEHR